MRSNSRAYVSVVVTVLMVVITVVLAQWFSTPHPLYGADDLTSVVQR